MKYKVLFIYKDSEHRIGNSGRVRGPYRQRLYFDYLPNHPNLEFTVRTIKEKTDVSKLSKGYDLLMIWHLTRITKPKIFGLEDLKIPWVIELPDPNGWRDIRKYIKMGLSGAYGFIHPNHVKGYGELQDLNFHQIIMPVDQREPSPWVWPRKNQKLCSTGAMRPSRFYGLRSKISKLPQSEIPPDTRKTGTSYLETLSQYNCGVAAMERWIVMKYYELPAAGLLTFMQETDRNGLKYSPFVDGESCIKINHKNYLDKINDYYNNFGDPRWERIAKNGWQLFWDLYSPQKQVDSLVKWLLEL